MTVHAHAPAAVAAPDAAGAAVDGHRPDIDGLRALAVGGVVLFHFGLGVPGGFAGVDVFFVISGFLITRIVLGQAAAGTFSMARFMERRVRRIFPACAVTVLACLAAGWFLLQPAELVALARAALAQAALVANFHFARGTGYFDPAAELQPLLHTWSLAVEEQFYLVFPLLLAAFAARGTAALRSGMAKVGAASLAVAVVMAVAAPTAGFYLPFGRAWEFLAGALLALPHAAAFTTARGRSVASLAGLAAIVGAYVLPAALLASPLACLAAAALGCAGAVLVIEAGMSAGDGAGTRVLGIAPLRAIGIVSYSVYLVHWPIAAFMRTVGDGALAGWWAPAGVAATLVLGTLSWRFVERPFRQGLGAGNGRASALLFACGTAMTVGVAAWFVAAKGLPARPIAVAAGPAAERVPRDFATESTDRMRPDRLPELRMGACGDGAAPAFAVWGDSHGMAISRTLDAAARAHGLCGIAALRPATAPLLGTWRSTGAADQRDWNDAAWRVIRDAGVHDLILVARWSINVDGRADGALDTLLTDAEARTTDRAGARGAVERGFARTVGAARAAGMDVWILLEPPTLELTRSQRAARRLYLGGADEALVDAARHAEFQRTVRAIVGALRRPGVHVVDLADTCLAGTARESDWNDADHLSPDGAERLLRGTIDAMLERIAAGRGAADAPSPR